MTNSIQVDTKAVEISDEELLKLVEAFYDDLLVKHDAFSLSRHIWIAARDFYTGHSRTIVYKDGTWKSVEAKSAWEYENDPDYLVTIPGGDDRALGFAKIALKCLLDYQEMLQDISRSRVGYMGDHSVYCEITFRVDRTRGKLDFLNDLLESEFANELREAQGNGK